MFAAEKFSQQYSPAAILAKQGLGPGESTFWWIDFSLRALWWIEFSLRALWWISRIRCFWLRMPDYVQYFRATVHLGDQQDTFFLVQDAKPVPVLQSRKLQSVCQYYYTSVLFAHYVPSTANLRFHCRPEDCPQNCTAQL